MTKVDRAEIYANETTFHDEKGSRYWMNRYSSYVHGATEQEAITKQEMIDKACEWLERANSALPPCYKMFKVNIENFRKAMEE